MGLVPVAIEGFQHQFLLDPPGDEFPRAGADRGLAEAGPADAFGVAAGHRPEAEIVDDEGAIGAAEMQAEMQRINDFEPFDGCPEMREMAFLRVALQRVGIEEIIGR